jgi:hypothetical protein
VADDAIDSAVQRLRDRSAAARVVEREATLGDWVTERFAGTNFSGRPDDEDEREEDQ